jgi:ligand-binding SRPBCC domain-containing protein
MVSSFTLVTRTTASMKHLFDLSLSIDEHMSSMDQSSERAIAGVTGGWIGLGETVTWRARHFGIWFTMTSKITRLVRPEYFVDEQVRGPFRSFHHEHRFALEAGETVMVDTLTITSPILGRLAERAVLVPYLRRLIRRRNEHLLRVLAETPPGSA